MRSDRSGSRKGKIGARALVCLHCINGHQARDRPIRQPSAMQLHRIGIAEDATGRHLLVDLSAATEAQCKTVAPAHTALSRHGCRGGAGFGPIRGVGVIALYQGSDRYELRCGQLYARTIVAPADRRHTGCAESVVLGDTCMVPRFTGS